MTGVTGSAGSIALVGALVATGYTGSPWMVAAALALAVVVLALGWGALLDLPARVGTGLVVVLTGLAGAGVAVLAAGVLHPLAPFAALMAGAVLLAFGHELVRRGGRPHLVESVSGTLSAQMIVLLGGGWVLLLDTRFGLAAPAVTGAAVVGAGIAGAVPMPRGLVGWVDVVAGTAVGAVVAVVLGSGRALGLVALAAVVAAVVVGLGRLLAPLAAGRAVPVVLAAAAAPVLTAGTTAYAVARLVA